MQPIISAFIQAIVRKYAVNEDEAFEILSVAVILDRPFNERFILIFGWDTEMMVVLTEYI